MCLHVDRMKNCSNKMKCTAHSYAVTAAVAAAAAAAATTATSNENKL